jgi:hypothetical protein
MSRLVGWVTAVAGGRRMLAAVRWTAGAGGETSWALPRVVELSAVRGRCLETGGVATDSSRLDPRPFINSGRSLSAESRAAVGARPAPGPSSLSPADFSRPRGPDPRGRDPLDRVNGPQGEPTSRRIGHTGFGLVVPESLHRFFFFFFSF